LQDKHFELTLADVNKPQLKLLPNPLVSADKTAKASPSPTAADDASSLEDENGTSADGDAIQRETINILTDLVDLQKSPRTADR
jgi:hypothetical protein